MIDVLFIVGFIVLFRIIWGNRHKDSIIRR